MTWGVYKITTFQKSSHPPGEARMKAILHGLELVGFKEVKKEIQAKWEEFKVIVDHKKPTGFSVAVPDKLLKLAAEFCLVGTKQIGCDIISPESKGKVCELLNNSWKQFWIDPENFYEWEKETVAQFKATL